MGNFSGRLDESISVCSEVSTTADSVTESCQFEQVTPSAEENDKTTENLCKSDEMEKPSMQSIENDDERPASLMESEECMLEFNASDNSNQSTDLKFQESDSVKSFTGDKPMFYCSGGEASNDENVAIYSQFDDFDGGEKSENNTLDSNDGNVSIKDEEQHIDSVAAFHDITEEEIDVEGDVLLEVSVEEEPVETSEIMAFVDSGPEAVAHSDTDSVGKKDPVLEVKEEDNRPKRERPPRKAETPKPRRRPQHDYVRKRNKRTAARLSKERKAKSKRKEEEDLDFATFDYAYFSELPEDDKCWFLATKDLLVNDDTEGTFKRETYKIVFVQNCDFFLYRLNCRTRAKEVSLSLLFLEKFAFFLRFNLCAKLR